MYNREDHVIFALLSQAFSEQIWAKCDPVFISNLAWVLDLSLVTGE